jgi:anti-sigma factor RsiW
MIDPSLTQTVRMYCDGELPPDEAQQFERKLERDIQLQQAVVFERSLRKRLSTLLASETTSAPAALADRVRQSLAREVAPVPIPMRANGQSSPEVGSAPPLQHPTWRISYLAVAAFFALVVGAVMFGVLFPQIDAMQTADVAPIEFFTAIGTAVASEHDRVAQDQITADEKLELKQQEEMAYQLSQKLGSRVTPIDLSERGYTLFGAGMCGGTLPCGGPSGHMLFKRVRKDGTVSGPNVSLFFVPEGHLADYLDEKLQRRWVDINGLSTKCGHRVLRLDYPDTGLVYFLVTCDPNELEPASKLVLEQLESANR